MAVGTDSMDDTKLLWDFQNGSISVHTISFMGDICRLSQFGYMVAEQIRYGRTDEGRFTELLLDKEISNAYNEGIQNE